MKTLIINANIINRDMSGFTYGALTVEDGIIACIGEPVADADEVIDAGGAYLLPGLVDIHIHGYHGTTFRKPRDFSEARTLLAKNGITTLLPTLSNDTVPGLVSSVSHILEERKKDIGARLGGIHFEGPFVSAEKCGAMANPPLKCDIGDFDAMTSAANGLPMVMTIAPELDGAAKIVKLGAAKGMRMSLGHTNATYAEAMACIEAGASGATHTFNAMRGYHHRESGVLGAVLTDKRVRCEMISDLVHLSEATIRLIIAAKGVDGVIAVSDSGVMSGLPDGDYVEDGVTRHVRGKVSRKDDGTIAGSCMNLSDGAKNLRALGYSLSDVAKMVSYNPAVSVGLDRVCGSIEVGKYADMILCDDSFDIKQVFVGGKTVK